MRLRSHFLFGMSVEVDRNRKKTKNRLKLVSAVYINCDKGKLSW